MIPLAEKARTLLVLGRVSNLPTVWSNLFVGYLLGIRPLQLISYPSLLLLLVSGSFLYIGGMYLNDYCDAAFDAKHCPQRPIPSQQISRFAVGSLALLWLFAGIACAIPFGWRTISIGLVLVSLIVLYDFHHKNVWWAPLVMGGCRFLLYPFAISIWPNGNFAAACLWGTIVGLYVAGITYVARGESRPEKPTRWALLFLSPPFLYALYLAEHIYFLAVYSLPALAWMTWLFVPLWRKTKPSIGRVVSGLLAGIILIDVIALLPGYFATPMTGVLSLGLFLLALLLQRFVPAT